MATIPPDQVLMVTAFGKPREFDKKPGCKNKTTECLLGQVKIVKPENSQPASENSDPIHQRR
jgi:hypothetical protein